MLAAGLIGAVLALAGVFALQAGGYLPSLDRPQETSAVTASTEQLDALSGEIAALRDELQEVVEAPGDSGATADQLAALGQRIDSLEQAASGAGADVAAAAQQAGETAAAAQQTASAAQESANAAQEAATAAQQSATQANEAATAAQQAAEQANAKVEEAVAQFESRIAGMEANNRQADVALAAANLKSAIDQGGPFMSQLETYAQAAGSGGATEDLRAFAADGVPSRQELATQWPEVEDRIAESLRPATPDAPVQEQLLSGLRSLVQVRPTGEAAATAEGPDAALARLDAAIERGDLAAWQSEWQALPQAAKDVSEDFASRVAARLTADQVVAETLSSVLTPAPTGGTGEAGGGAAPDQPSGQGNQG